jgi:hypothetical protein
LGDHRSPNKWIAKIDPAIAHARMAGGTVSKMSVFTGPVARKSKAIAAIKPSLAAARSPSAKAAYAAGAAASELNTNTQA